MLFVKSAEGVEDVVWDNPRVREFLFHFPNSRAEVAATDARGHGDHAFQIVAHDFGLTAERSQRGDALERKEMSVGRAEKEVVDVTHRLARVLRNPNAHPDEFRLLLHVRCHVAGQEIIQ